MTGWSVYTAQGGGGWSVYRMGTAAAATTPPGRPPAYGMVNDLASLPLDDEGFADWARLQAQMSQADLVQQLNGATQGDYSKELERARNYEKLGYSMSNEDFNLDEGGFFSDVQVGFRLLRNEMGRFFTGSEETDLSKQDLSYSAYKRAGGILTEDDYNQFADQTRWELIERASTARQAETVANLPGVSQGLAATYAGYRGLTTFGMMAADIRGAGGIAGQFDPRNMRHLRRWFDQDEWSQKWRASNDRSLGNAIIDNILSPTVSEDTLDDWRRNNALYQMTSVGAEFAGGWYADLGVIAGRGLGNALRVARNEMPLREKSRMFSAIREAQQGREIISVQTGAAKKYAAWRAERTMTGMRGVDEYARNVDFATFANLPMFRRRAEDGIAAAKALHIAANSGDPDLIDLSWRYLNGDLSAVAKVREMKMDPSVMGEFGDNASTFIEAIDATKTRAAQLEEEIENLKLAGESGSPFHRWEIHAEQAVKEQELARAQTALDSYGGDYKDWLELMGTSADDVTNPMVSQYQAPKKVAINDVSERQGTGVNRFFLKDTLGFGHRVVKTTRSAWIKKAGTASMHDLDSGKRLINRQATEFEQILDYRLAPEVRDEYLSRLTSAETAMERYQLLNEFESTHLPGALAAKLGISEDLTRAVLDKIDEERNRTIRGVISGKGRQYSSAPSLQQRIGDELSTVRLVGEADDEGMVTLEFMDGQIRTTAMVHESALVERKVPIDPTQTPNYFEPADVRRIYLEMKRHEDVLATLEAGPLKKGSAELARVNDIVGTKFYALWKPAQLWRFGWPQRVLMDEGMRAMAIFGPMYWMTGPGAESVLTAARNIPAHLYRTYDLKRNGALNLADGPLSRAEKRSNPFAHQEEKAAAVKIAHTDFPKINESRYNRLRKDVEMRSAFWRANDARRAWAREVVEANNADDAVRKARAMEKLSHYELKVLRANMARPSLGDSFEQIIDAARSRANAFGREEAEAIRDQAIPQVFDPVTGKEIKSGFFLPLDGYGPEGIDMIALSTRAFSRKNLDLWIEKNAELLARQGIRVGVDLEGKIQVGRYFSGRGALSRAQRALADYAQQLDLDVQPKMYDVGSKTEYLAAERNALSPFVEAYHRYFGSEEVEGLAAGESPADGVPQVFHGGALPEGDLLPRDEVYAQSGQMMGAGLYTTVDIRVAEDYAWGNKTSIYTIRNSKTGQRYEIFDADQVMTPDDLARFERYVEEKLAYTGEMEQWWRSMRDIYKEARALRKSAGRNYVPFATKKLPRNQISWANFMEMVPEGGSQKRILTEFFEEEYGAGAITHTGGTTRVGGPNHQVYVWLKPEDLDVIPAYSGTNTWVPLEKWFRDPASLEMPVQFQDVPENRIVRYGQRNPMFRQLHQIHAKAEARKAELTRGRADLAKRLGDPEYQRLLEQERSLMSALGLEYRGHGMVVDARTNAWGQDWYEIADADKFNRMFDEALGMNRQVDWAAAANGDLRAQELVNSLENRGFALEDFDVQIDNMTSYMLRKVGTKREAGVGQTMLRASDGSVRYMDNAYEGHEGEMLRSLVSSDRAMDALSDGHGGALQAQRRYGAAHKTYHPPVFTAESFKKGTPENKKAMVYFQQYTAMVNNQIANSPIWSKMLEGWSDAKIERWLKNTPEGAAVRRELKGFDNEGDIALWVNEHRAKLDYYLPSKKLQRILAKEKLKPSDIRRNVHNDDLPDVFGPDTELTTRSFLNRVADTVWKSLGTIPIDAFSRHPFAKATYDAKMVSLVSSVDADFLDDAAIKRMQKIAHTHTLNQVRRTLFDLSDSTNMTDALRFIAPFWNAQSEAILKWINIISDRPETVARFFNGTRAVYKNFVILDEENNEVTTPLRKGGMFGDLGLGAYHPNDKVVLNVPEWMEKTPLGKSLTAIGKLGIPIGSANTVLQGEMPLNPSTGPYVTIPIDKFLRVMSDQHGIEYSEDGLDAYAYRWLFPIGRPQGGFRGVLEQLSPGWGRRVMSASAGEDDVAKANLFWQVGREMTLEAQRKGEPAPTNEEIQTAARWLWGLRTVTSFMSPVQVEFRPKNQFWVDTAHRYRQEHGATWFDEFVADYGSEAAAYAVSSSNSLASIPPTLQGMEEWADNKKLIQKFPHWGEAIISPDAYGDDYHQDAYRAQFEINLGPGDSRTLRDVQDPTARAGIAQSRLGWLEFRKMQSSINAELYARGLTSIQQSGAEDLAFLKAQFVSALTDQYPAWRTDYDEFSNNIYQRVEELSSFAFNREFDKRPDMQGARQYLIIREQVAEQLDQRYVAGGSRSLQSEENTDLRGWFYSNVGQLILDNPAFGEFYSRFLDGDTMLQGGG